VGPQQATKPQQKEITNINTKARQEIKLENERQMQLQKEMERNLRNKTQQQIVTLANLDNAPVFVQKMGMKAQQQMHRHDSVIDTWKTLEDQGVPMQSMDYGVVLKTCARVMNTDAQITMTSEAKVCCRQLSSKCSQSIAKEALPHLAT